MFNLVSRIRHCCPLRMCPAHIRMERPLHVLLHPLGSPLCRYEGGSMGQVVRDD